MKHIFWILMCPTFSFGCLFRDTAKQINVYGKDLEVCSSNPKTGWFRDGFCRTDENDRGLHTVCASMTKDFLDYTRSQGNDLSTPRGKFPGLKPGDRWCLCARRWEQAHHVGKAPKIHLAATHIRATDINPLPTLKSLEYTVNKR